MGRLLTLKPSALKNINLFCFKVKAPHQTKNFHISIQQVGNLLEYQFYTLPLSPVKFLWKSKCNLKMYVIIGMITVKQQKCLI